MVNRIDIDHLDWYEQLIKADTTSDPKAVSGCLSTVFLIMHTHVNYGYEDNGFYIDDHADPFMKGYDTNIIPSKVELDIFAIVVLRLMLMDCMHLQYHLDVCKEFQGLYNELAPKGEFLFQSRFDAIMSGDRAKIFKEFGVYEEFASLVTTGFKVPYVPYATDRSKFLDWFRELKDAVEAVV